MTLLGIRVYWTVKPEYQNCQYNYLRAHIYTDPHVHRLKSKILARGTTSHVFDNHDVLCNQHYIAQITYSIGTLGVGDANYQLRLFYGSKLP